jgi:hypothetical protein
VGKGIFMYCLLAFSFVASGFMPDELAPKGYLVKEDRAIEGEVAAAAYPLFLFKVVKSSNSQFPLKRFLQPLNHD